MTGNKITEIERGRRHIDPLEIDPQALLPILKKWRCLEPDKYRSLVNVICASADIAPETLTGETNGRRRE